MRQNSAAGEKRALTHHVALDELERGGAVKFNGREDFCEGPGGWDGVPPHAVVRRGTQAVHSRTWAVPGRHMGGTLAAETAYGCPVEVVAEAIARLLAPVGYEVAAQSAGCEPLAQSPATRALPAGAGRQDPAKGRPEPGPATGRHSRRR